MGGLFEMARVLGAALLVGLVACGGESHGPVAPGGSGADFSRLTVAGGDDQVRFPASALPDPLVVQLADAGGASVSRAGIAVTWRVVEGGGSIEAGASVTDESGRASATWTLGPVDGPQVVEVSAAGAAPLAFRARARAAGPIVFSSNRAGEGEASKLFVMDEDGGDIIQLTLGPENDSQPHWSPDGTQIVFTRSTGGRLELFVVGSDGRNERQLTTGGGARPRWSPDGTTIVFERDRAIWTIRPIDGSEALLMTSELGDGDPDWSPDGSKIVFSRTTRTVPLLEQIFVMDADGTNVRQLSDEDASGAIQLRLPTWSPDGSYILYLFRDRRSSPVRLQVNISPFSPTGRFIRTSSLGDGEPGAWGPDSERVLIVPPVGAEATIVIANVVTNQRTPLTDGPFRDRWPDWRR